MTEPIYKIPQHHFVDDHRLRITKAELVSSGFYSDIAEFTLTDGKRKAKFRIPLSETKQTSEAPGVFTVDTAVLDSWAERFDREAED